MIDTRQDKYLIEVSSLIVHVHYRHNYININLINKLLKKRATLKELLETIKYDIPTKN
jgi:hypothetical protein